MTCLILGAYFWENVENRNSQEDSPAEGIGVVERPRASIEALADRMNKSTREEEASPAGAPGERSRAD